MIAVWSKRGVGGEEKKKTVEIRKWKDASMKEMVDILKKEMGGVGKKSKERNEWKGDTSGSLEEVMAAWHRAWEEIKRKHAPRVKMEVREKIKRSSWLSKETKDRIKHNKKINETH